MKTTGFSLARILGFVTAILFVGTLATHAADETLGTAVGTVAVPNGLPKAEVQSAIVMSLAGRGWAVQQKDGEKVVGYLKHRSNEATVTLVYDDKQVALYCVGYAINKSTGERKKPELPTGWLNYLKGDLTKKMNQATVTH